MTIHTNVTRRALLATSSATAAAAAILGQGPSARATSPRHPRKPLRLTVRGTSTTQILVDPRESTITIHAASELADYLEQISGATIPVVVSSDRPDGPMIIVGHRNDWAGALFDDIVPSALGDDGFALRTADDAMVIFGASDRGDLYGCYWVLDHLLGVRWFSEDFTVVPTRPTITIPITPSNIDCVPRFRHREMLCGDATRSPAYRQHNLLNGNSLSNGTYPPPPEIDTWSEYWPRDNQHNFHKIVTDSSLWSGRQLKAMNPDTREQAITELVERLSPQVGQVTSPIHGFAQMDGGDWEPDPDSAAFIADHGGARSAAVIDLVNTVADGVAVQVPGARLGTFAYQWSFAPPTGITVNDHVVLTVAPAHADQGRCHLEPGSETEAAIQTWATLSNNLVLWDYLANFQSYVQPYPNWRSSAQNVQGLAAIPTAHGYFGQAAYTSRGGDFGNLRTWVQARLSWDPTLNADELITEFLEGFYGPAAPLVEEYMNILETAVAVTSFKLRPFIAATCPYLSYETIRAADSMLSEATEAVAGDTVFRRHLAHVRMGLDFVILIRQSDLRLSAAALGDDWDPTSGGRFTRFDEALTTSGLTENKQYKMPPERMRELAGTVQVAPSVPAVASGLPADDWITVHGLAANLTPSVTAVPDSSASSAVCVSMPGTPANWGIQFPLSVLPQTGSWRLYLAARVTAPSADPGTRALAAGVYPALGSEQAVLTVGDVPDAGYLEIPLPGTFTFDDSGRYIYVAAPDQPSVESVLVDRLIAVRDS